MTDTTLNRRDLQAIFGNNHKAIAAFERIQSNANSAASTSAQNVAATQALQDATAITLSPNDALTRERVLNVGPGLQITDNGAGSTVLISLTNPVTINGAFTLTFNLVADSYLDFPATGRVPSSADGPYADDTAASAAGIPIGGWYAKTGGTVVWRQV